MKSMFKFSRIANANSFVDHCISIMMIVHWDDGLLWVVTPHKATRLARAGYEVVR
jgi:hypothetical protein